MSSGLNAARSQYKNSKAASVSNVAELIEQMHSLFSEIEANRVQRTRAHLLSCYAFKLHRVGSRGAEGLFLAEERI